MSLVTRVRRVMGTAIEIALPGERADLVEPAFSRLEWIERTFSVYRPDSQISRIATGDLAVVDAHPLVQGVLDDCAKLERATDGWFQPHAPERDRPLDPSAYVKGWAIDMVIDDLVAVGVGSAWISAGGDVAVIGTRPDGTPWRAGIRGPDEGTLAAVVGIVAGGVATSGASERGNHIWGGSDNRLHSVSVVGPSLGTADALATAIYAAGEDLSWFSGFEPYGCLLVHHDGSLQASVGMERRLIA